MWTLIFYTLIFLLPLTGNTAAAPPADLYDYDRTIPLDYQGKLIGEREGVKIFDASYASPKGGRVAAYLVVPKGKGPFAGIIFQHGGGQTRLSYLAEAVMLARSGAVCLVTDDAPRNIDPLKPEIFRDENIRLVVDMRRAVDLLLLRGDVDKDRIAYVGHSYGATPGGILTAVDKRIKTFVLAGGVVRLTEHMRSSQISFWTDFRKQIPPGQLEDYLKVIAPLDAANYIGRSSPAPVLVQCARFDNAVTEQDCRGLYEAAGHPKRLLWYDADHDFHDLNAILDRAQWLRTKLRLRPLARTMLNRRHG
jgi:cephalosporin-C deacetylase-like acetyl esterase